jgi:hypothetical protein
MFSFPSILIFHISPFLVLLAAILKKIISAVYIFGFCLLLISYPDVSRYWDIIYKTSSVYLVLFCYIFVVNVLSVWFLFFQEHLVT